MRINDVIQGFKVIQVYQLEDINAVLYQMVHENTKAKLCYIERDDDNKTFSVTFKTTPSDDTGVFHILEHSVLNGSKKYPVKEPFVELLKSSLQTYLNAMTFPDKTVYPVSSRNEKDFDHLMSVYMDAVFHPSIYDNPNIFYQEGWHYDIQKGQDYPIHKGVVLNEMKGAFSQVDTQLVNHLNRLLFPNNTYGYESGGDPKAIVKLTYEDFIATHQKYYHPSNAYFMLDGKMNIEEVLKKIDTVLEPYDYLDVNVQIPMVEKQKQQVESFYYPVMDDEDAKDKVQVCIAKIVANYDDVKQPIAWNALLQALVGSNDAPLKKCLIDENLVQDVELELYDGIKQPWAVLTLRNTSEDKADRAIEMIMETAKQLVEEGLDHDDIFAAINGLEFKYFEPQEPAGLLYIINALQSWLYCDDPTMYLKLSAVFAQLKEDVNHGYFENLLKSFLLEGNLTIVKALPDTTLQKKIDEETENQVKTYYDSLTEDEKNDLLNMNEKLLAWQQTADSKEKLDTLPKLSLADVKAELNILNQSVKKTDTYTLIQYEKAHPKIIYTNLYFALNQQHQGELAKIHFFTDLLMNLPTKNYSLKKLQTTVLKHLGRLRFYNQILPIASSDKNIVQIGVEVRCLSENTKMAQTLVQEVIQNTIFDRQMIQPLLKQMIESMWQTIISSGHIFAVSRAKSRYSSTESLKDTMLGYQYYQFLKQVDEHFDEVIDQYIEDFHTYAKTLFTQSNLTVSSNQEDVGEIEGYFTYLPVGVKQDNRISYPCTTYVDDFIETPSQVSYGAYAGKLDQIGKNHGEYFVANQILTYDYLWQEVRVKNGAYGTGFQIDPTGVFVAYSYRDPNYQNSIQAFKNAGQALKNMVLNTEDISSFVIGSYGGADGLETIAGKILGQDRFYFMEVSPQDRLERRKQILSTSRETLLELANQINNVNGVFSVVGKR